MTESQRVENANVGRVIGEKYRIDAVVGSGANGTVYRATHLTLGKPIALKVLNANLLTNDAARGRFRREARAASRLDHPNSVQVLDFGSEPDGLSYIAMEFLEGRELYKAIYDDWPLGTERTVRIMSDVLSCLAAAHDAGIVHRDLKPENIMLVKRTGADGKSSEVVKVADFGIAKSFAGPVSEDSMNLTRDGAVPGTPEYMSPEHARGLEIDGRADIYACGVVLYEMMCGQLPFSADSPIDVILKQINEAPRPPTSTRADVDARLEPVVLRALAKRREDRYQTASEMRDALLAAASQPRPSSAVGLGLPRATQPTGESTVTFFGSPGDGHTSGGAPADELAPNAANSDMAAERVPPDERPTSVVETQRQSPPIWALVLGGALVVVLAITIVLVIAARSAG